MALTREQILAKTVVTAPPERVSVPEWDSDVFVRVMSGHERDGWEQSIIGEDKQVSMTNIRAKLLVRCVCDEAGKRLFSDDDADALGETSAVPLDRLFPVAQRLNRLTK